MHSPQNSGQLVKLSSFDQNLPGRMEKLYFLLKQLVRLYNSKTKQQINVLRITAFILSAIPYIGWYLIAPWLIPLILYLEYHYKPTEK